MVVGKGALNRVVTMVLEAVSIPASGMAVGKGALKRVVQPLLEAVSISASGMAVGIGALSQVGATKVLKAQPLSA